MQAVVVMLSFKVIGAVLARCVSCSRKLHSHSRLRDTCLRLLRSMRCVMQLMLYHICMCTICMCDQLMLPHLCGTFGHLQACQAFTASCLRDIDALGLLDRTLAMKSQCESKCNE